MALKEIQTAAVRLVHVTDPNDRDVATLQQRFALHPHDAEAILSVHEANSIRPYRDYVHAGWLWPNYDRDYKDITLDEVSVITGPATLILVDRSKADWMQAFIDRRMQPDQVDWQATPLTLLGELLIQRARETEREAEIFSQQVATSIGDRDAVLYGQALLGLSDSLEQLADHAAAQGEQDGLELLRIAAHRLNHRGQQLLALRRQAVRQPQASPFVLPKVVHGYAVASVITALLVLGFMIGR